jgi:hypothetical protein
MKRHADAGGRHGLIVWASAMGLSLAVAGCGGKKEASVGIAPGPDAAAPTGPGPETLDPGLAALAQKAAPDMTAEGLPLKTTLAAGAHSQAPITMQPGRCYSIIGFSPAGAVADLDLALLAAAAGNQPIAQDGSQDGSPVIGPSPSPLCPNFPQATQYTLDIFAKVGAGVVGVQVLSKPQAVAAAADATDAAVKTASAKLAPGMDPDGAPSKYTLVEGAPQSLMINLVGGRCYTVIAASQPGGVTDVELVLMAPPFFTLPVESDKRTDSVAVIGGGNSPQCPIAPLPVPYKLSVGAKKGAGPVTVQLFSKLKK